MGWVRLIPSKKGQVAILIKMVGFVISPNLFELNPTQGSIKKKLSRIKLLTLVLKNRGGPRKFSLGGSTVKRNIRGGGKCKKNH